jgi:hypothetical protein
MLRLDRLQLDGHFFACRHVRAQVNVAKGSAANLAAQAVLLPNAQFHLKKSIRLLTHKQNEMMMLLAGSLAAPVSVATDFSAAVTLLQLLRRGECGVLEVHRSSL